jgi:hypothetical protein
MGHTRLGRLTSWIRAEVPLDDLALDPSPLFVGCPQLIQELERMVDSHLQPPS